MTSIVSEHSRQCMQCSVIFHDITNRNQFSQQKHQIFFEQIFFLKSLISVTVVYANFQFRARYEYESGGEFHQDLYLSLVIICERDLLVHYKLHKHF